MLRGLSHPSLVAFIAAGTHVPPGGGREISYLVMEPAMGGDLRTLVVDAIAQPDLYGDLDVVVWLHQARPGSGRAGGGRSAVGCRG